MRYFIPFALFFSSFIFAQTIKGTSYSITTNYNFLDEVLKNKKLVLLGEQSHSDGATFDEKVNLIKYLHEKLGFNTIAFESGMYDNYRAFKQFATKNQKTDIYNESIGSIWSDTKSFQNLQNYIDERSVLKDTLKIIGFDSQEYGFFDNNFIDDLKQVFKTRKLKISKDILTKIEKVLVAKDIDNIATNKKDSLDLKSDYNYILNSFKSIKNISLHEKMMQQVFVSSMSDIDFQVMQLQNQKIASQNPRDKQMAENLIFLSQLNPNQKIICWGASYHFARNLGQYEYTSLTESYFNQQGELEKKISGQTDYKPGDGKEILKDALPMGQMLKNYFKDTMYSLAFSSYDGEYGVVNDKKFPMLTPPEQSIEKQLYDTKSEKVFFNYNSENQEGFYSSALGNIPLKAKWNNIFDGLLFITTSYQPESRTYDKSIFLNTDDTTFKISGKVYNLKTNRPIPNTEIRLSNANYNTKSNTSGTFNFEISKNNFSDNIIITFPGFVNDTIAVANLIKTNKNILNIRLRPYLAAGYLLNPVIINKSNKELSAKEILEKAYKNIELNYYQNPYNQTFYFKSSYILRGEKNSSNEAFIKTYNKKGMTGTNDPYVNIYSQVEQLKTLKDKISNNYFTGKTMLWYTFCRDLILSKSNVLYKTDSYNLKKESEVEYENRTVYKISFTNNNPGSYSTGFGYPSPKASSGFLYVDTENFAILKYEHCVIREPFIQKNEAKTNIVQTHKIIETFKNTNGFYFIDQLTTFTKSVLSSNYDNYLEKSDKYQIQTLKSHNLELKNLEIIKVPIDKIDETKSFAEDTAFWKNNPVVLENTKIEFDVCE